MTNILIPNNEFQTSVPSNSTLLTVRSTSNASPSNNDLLDIYGLTTTTIIPEVLYTQGTCFNSMANEILITTKEELFIYLCDVLIRFDASPEYYQKEDFEVLIKLLVKSLIHLYDMNPANPTIPVELLAQSPLYKPILNTIGLNYNTQTLELIGGALSVIYKPDPVDDLLNYDGTKYTPYTTKKLVDPGYPYFYNDINEVTPLDPSFIYNQLKLDGQFVCAELAIQYNGELGWYSTGGLGFSVKDYLNNTFNASITVGTLYSEFNSRFIPGVLGITAQENDTKAIPILIGQFGYFNGEYIKIDDFNQLFDINMTNVILNKGTAGKYYGTDANKKLVPMTDPDTF
jgi:hypothetical protein